MLRHFKAKGAGYASLAKLTAVSRPCFYAGTDPAVHDLLLA